MAWIIAQINTKQSPVKENKYPLVCSDPFPDSIPTASHGFAAAQLQSNCMTPVEQHPRSVHGTW